MEQWGKPLVYYKTKGVLGFPGEESLVFIFYPHEGLFSAIYVRRTPSQGTTLALASKMTEAMRTATGQWGPDADVRRSPRQEAALAVAAKARDIVDVHRVLAHPSKEITQKSLRQWESRRRASGGPARRACRWSKMAGGAVD